MDATDRSHSFESVVWSVSINVSFACTSSCVTVGLLSWCGPMQDGRLIDNWQIELLIKLGEDLFVGGSSKLLLVVATRFYVLTLDSQAC